MLYKSTTKRLISNMLNAGITIPNMNTALPVSSTTISGMLPAMQNVSNLSPLTHDIFNPRPSCNNDILGRVQRVQSFLGFPWQASAYRQLFQQQQAINGQLLAQLQGCMSCGTGMGGFGMNPGMGMNNGFALTQPGMTSPFAMATPMTGGVTGLASMPGVAGTVGLNGLANQPSFGATTPMNSFSANGLTYTPINSYATNNNASNTTADLLGQLLAQLFVGQQTTTTPIQQSNPFGITNTQYGAL